MLYSCGIFTRLITKQEIRIDIMKTLRYFFYFFIIVFQVIDAEEVKPDLALMIPMRDGVKLPTDLYLPSADARDLPCILVRSPAGRRFYVSDAVKLAKDGYAVAIQETRSVLDTEGKTLPFRTQGH